MMIGIIITKRDCSLLVFSFGVVIVIEVTLPITIGEIINVVLGHIYTFSTGKLPNFLIIPTIYSFLIISIVFAMNFGVKSKYLYGIMTLLGVVYLLHFAPLVMNYGYADEAGIVFKSFSNNSEQKRISWDQIDRTAFCRVTYYGGKFRQLDYVIVLPTKDGSKIELFGEPSSYQNLSVLKVVKVLRDNNIRVLATLDQ